MNMQGVNELLKDKRVVEEIHKHLWIESQKAGQSIGIERAKEEWLSRHALEWLRYNEPQKFEKMIGKRKK